MRFYFYFIQKKNIWNVFGVIKLWLLVKKPMEQLVDGEALRSLASTLVTSIESHINGGITPSHFVSCLLKDFVQQHGKGRGASKFSRDSVSWKKLGSFVSPIFRNCKGCRTMWVFNSAVQYLLRLNLVFLYVRLFSLFFCSLLW